MAFFFEFWSHSVCISVIPNCTELVELNASLKMSVRAYLNCLCVLSPSVIIPAKEQRVAQATRFRQRRRSRIPPSGRVLGQNVWFGMFQCRRGLGA